METTTKQTNIKVQSMPEKTFAYITHVGPYKGDQALFARLFGQVVEWAGPEGLLENTRMEMITVYHDDHQRVPKEELRISVGITVPRNTVVPANMKTMIFPSGDYAVGSFEIDPADYGTAWESMMSWIANNQLKFALEPMYESYKNNPQEHPEGKHIVDICIPLVK